MNDAKYIGMDVHQATISVAVRDSRGNLVMEAILKRKRNILSLYGSRKSWCRAPSVADCCDAQMPCKSDRIDARKLSELLYLNKLSPVHHGEPGIRT